MIGENPLFTGEPVGGPLFNLILLGYGLPAVLAITLALIARTTRPMPYRAAAAVTSVALALMLLSLEVTRAFHGPVLTDGITTDAEQYTYSAVWLGFGVVLLLFGIAIGSKPARLASAAVVLLTIAKVFVVDTAGLSGVWRSLSLIALLTTPAPYSPPLFPHARSRPTLKPPGPRGTPVGADQVS
jgi:uncharacterized membrane protein